MSLEIIFGIIFGVIMGVWLSKKLLTKTSLGDRLTEEGRKKKEIMKDPRLLMQKLNKSGTEYMSSENDGEKIRYEIGYVDGKEVLFERRIPTSELEREDGELEPEEQIKGDSEEENAPSEKLELEISQEERKKDIKLLKESLEKQLEELKELEGKL